MIYLKILVDGSNIAFATYNIVGRKKIAKFSNIKLIIDFLEHLKNKNPQVSISFFILCDSTLRYRIDYPNKLEELIHKGKIIQSPAGTQTDDFLLNYLKKNHLNTCIISNDTFHQCPKDLEKDKNSWRIPYLIFDNQILIPKLEQKILDLSKNLKLLSKITIFQNEKPIEQSH